VYIELSTVKMRKHFDIASAQNKELCALAQEIATEVAKPLNTGGASSRLSRFIDIWRS
jgi:hypothetical protein